MISTTFCLLQNAYYVFHFQISERRPPPINWWCVTDFYILWFIVYFHLKDISTQKERERERDLLSIALLSRWSQQPGGSQELFLGPLHGCRGPSTWAILQYFPGLFQELDQKCRTRTWTSTHKGSQAEANLLFYGASSCATVS